MDNIIFANKTKTSLFECVHMPNHATVEESKCDLKRLLAGLPLFSSTFYSATNSITCGWPVSYNFCIVMLHRQRNNTLWPSEGTLISSHSKQRFEISSLPLWSAADGQKLQIMYADVTGDAVIVNKICRKRMPEHYSNGMTVLHL
jgi:hypothetical protein